MDRDIDSLLIITEQKKKEKKKPQWFQSLVGHHGQDSALKRLFMEHINRIYLVERICITYTVRLHKFFVLVISCSPNYITLKLEFWALTTGAMFAKCRWHHPQRGVRI